ALKDCCAVQARAARGRGRSRARPPERTARQRDLLRTRLRDAREQGADLRLPVPAVTAQGTDGPELAGLRPPRHGLRIHPKHRRNLGWRQKRLCFRRACRHVYGLLLDQYCDPALGLSWLRAGACGGWAISATAPILPSPPLTRRLQ